MTRFVTQQEPLISLSDHRTSSHAREHDDQARGTQLRKPITSVPLTGTGAGSSNSSVGASPGVLLLGRSEHGNVCRGCEMSWDDTFLLTGVGTPIISDTVCAASGLKPSDPI